MSQLLTIEEAAAELRHPSPRSLRDWLCSHPLGLDGLPLFIQRGRAKLFPRVNLDRIREVEKHLESLPKEHSYSGKTVGWVYFVRTGNFIKIGWSLDWRKRLRHMQTAAPELIDPIGAIPGTIKVERLLHREFASLRARGEWFRAAEPLLAYIEQRRQVGALVTA